MRALPAVTAGESLYREIEGRFVSFQFVLDKEIRFCYDMTIVEVTWRNNALHKLKGGGYMKRVSIVLLQCLVYLLFGTVLHSVVVSAAQVPVNEATFPDADFRQYISGQIDKNKDGILSDDEISGTRVIVIDSNNGQGLRVGNFQGIEVFTELEELRIWELVDSDGGCPYYVDIYLNLSDNRKLKVFECEAGTVRNLDLSGNLLLEELSLQCTYPVQDLSRLIHLKRVRVGSNVVLPDEMPEITELKVGNIEPPGKMPMLETLYLITPKLPATEFKMDFHVYPKLSNLTLSGVNMTELDLSWMNNLKSFSCMGDIETINLRGCSALEELSLSGVSFVSNVYLGGCVNIRTLNYSQARLLEIQFRDLTNLEYLNCEYLDSGLKVLDLSNNHKLKIVHASANQLTDVKLSPLAAYEELWFMENRLTNLDLRNIKVESIYCDYNKLKKVQLSKKTKYKEISLNNNRLKQLDLRNVKAERVMCQRNNLKKLLLSPKGKYKYISVDWNFLTELDLRNINVMTVTCRDNMIRSLKVRRNKTIRELDCRHNKLKALDVRQCKKLRKLIWYSGATKGLKKRNIRRK